MNRFTTAALFLALLGMTSPAKAGFEWIPPTSTEAQRPVLAQPAQPMASDTMVPMPDKPATTQMQTTTTTVTTQPAPAPRQEIVRQRVENTAPTIAWNDSQTSAPAQPMPVAMTTSSSNAPRDLTPEPGPSVIGSSDKVEGFGRDVPLTVATRQMVPQGYVVQYGQGVDPNMTVSWTGGRAWKEALGDALAEKNLKATVIADSVMIEPVAPAQQLRAEPLATIVEAAPAPLPPVTEVTVTNTTMTATTATSAPSPMMQNVSYSPAPVAAPMPAPQVWVAPRASTLRQVLTDWSREAGVQMQWSAQYDYPLMSDVQLTGTFEEAVETLLSGLVDAQPRPVARLHPNAPNGPAILVVETRHILE